MKVKRALISVSDKSGLLGLGRGLDELGIDILSTGGTAIALRQADIRVIQVSDFTGSPEILDGRVKTLHPKIHGGLLGRRNDVKHQAQMTANGIVPIDLLVVNLYPFQATIAKPNCTLEEATEKIDIGGPAMIRSAAKNRHDVGVVVDPDDYLAVLEELRSSSGSLSDVTRFRLAVKAFNLTADYDGAIADYLGSLKEDGTRHEFGETAHLALKKTDDLRYPVPGVPPRAYDLRYGENPHQRAALYGNFGRFAQQLEGGKDLSYNNVVDVNAALWLMREFKDDPRHVVAILKHNTPCGVGVATTDLHAFELAFKTDPDSPFGGIVIVNKQWSEALARRVKEIFTEVLIAPSFEETAWYTLREKKNLRLMVWYPEAMESHRYDMRGVLGGVLVQTPDLAMEHPWREGEVVTQRSPSTEEYAAMQFGLKVVKHVKSNGIVFCDADQTRAIAGGGTSRVDPVRDVVKARVARLGIDLKGSVAASEAFFPFPDGIDEIAALGATAIVQPGGSQNDPAAIDACDRNNIAMVFTGVRHFRH